MISYIKGTITYKNPTYVLIETGGIGYQVFISLNTYTKIQNSEQIKLNTYLHVTETSQTLYGFAEETEKTLFIQLISVSGIGPALARVALSSLTPEELYSAIVHEREEIIRNIKGIGPKSAKRLILELKDKLAKGSDIDQITAPKRNTNREEALSALVALGFNKSIAEKAVNLALSSGKDFEKVEDLIKISLKSL